MSHRSKGKAQASRSEGPNPAAVFVYMPFELHFLLGFFAFLDFEVYRSSRFVGLYEFIVKFLSTLTCFLPDPS